MRRDETRPRADEPVTVVEPGATAMVFMGAGKPHEPVSVPRVVLRTGEALVEVELATICASDLHTVRGERSEPVPLVLGHEYVGRVHAVGPGGMPATDGAPLEPGDRVVWSIAARCGDCDRCRRGLPQKCRALRKYGHQRIGAGWELSGGFATHVHLVAGTPVVRVAEGVPGEVLAPATCGIATARAALAAAERTAALEGATVLVSGAGLIGLAATAMAHERGARVVVSDPSPERRETARRFGAEHLLRPGDGLPVAGDGRQAEIEVVIEASGAPAAVSSALEVAGVGATVVLVGSVFPTDSVSLAPERLVRGLVTVTGVHNYLPSHLDDATAFVQERWHHYPLAELVGVRYPLIELDRALERAQEHREVRVGIEPGTGSG